MLEIEALFDLSHTRGDAYLRQSHYPWEALAGLKNAIVQLGEVLPRDEFSEISPQVWVHRTAQIAPSASLGSPCIIGARTQVRHGAFVRGSALVGDDCVVGNSVEVKNVILFDGVQVPHFNYVGDSILGYKAHMGAGAITSNVRADKALVTVHAQPPIPTGIKKVGAFLGDGVEVGCNSVLNPGTVIGRNTQIYPLSCVRGIVAADSIYKTGGIIVHKEAQHG